jgi:hypothetical protein
MCNALRRARRNAACHQRGFNLAIQMKERKLTLSHNLDIVAMQVKALLGGDVWGADDVQMSAPTGAEPRGGGGRDARPALQTSTKHKLMHVG